VFEIFFHPVEIPTRCSFIIEFIIPNLLKAQHVSSGTPLIIRSSKTVIAASGTYTRGCRYSLELIIRSFKLYLHPLVYIPEDANTV